MNKAVIYIRVANLKEFYGNSCKQFNPPLLLPTFNPPIDCDFRERLLTEYIIKNIIRR